MLHGGTCFDAPTKYVNQRRFDGHIIITDMLAPAPVRSNCQRMWITDRYGASNAKHNYGHSPIGERMLVL